MKIPVFEYLMYRLKDWSMELNRLNSISDFNDFNDFSILKAIKLHFLIISIDSANDSTLLNEHSFYAMPYGPVESDLYSHLKSGNSFNGFSINNFKTTFENHKDINSLNIDDTHKKLIDSAIKKIKTTEPFLINASASALVDLTHRWSSWVNTYEYAMKHGVHSSPIHHSLIRNDNKILSINTVL